jgi:signal transduction histidine kinase
MLLSELARGENDASPKEPGQIKSQLNDITQKARQVATAMDEVVWTVDPKNDCLPDLASYLCDYAREFLRAANVNCRFDMMEELPELPVTAQQRHNLFMAVKEALNNAVKHSGAGEVWLRILWADGALAVSVEDNGRGFNPAEARECGNGLQNMRTRLESIHGEMDYSTGPGHGAKISFALPLAASGAIHKAESLN